MAKKCANCGQTLPRDDALFCSKCGARIPARLPASQSTSTSKGSPPSSVGRKNKPVLREQIAQQPPFRPPQRPVQGNPPAWISQLDTVEHREMPSDHVEVDQQEKPSQPADVARQEKSPQQVNVEQLAEIPTRSWPGVHTGQTSQVEPSTQQDVTSLDTRIDVPISEPGPQKPTVRELHVKVWEQKEPTAPTTVAEEKSSGKEDAVEDLPTRPLIAEHPEVHIQPASMSPPIHDVQSSSSEEVTDFDTVPLLTQPQVRPIAHPAEQLAQQPEWTRQPHPQPGDRAAAQRSTSAEKNTSPPPLAQPTMLSAQEQDWQRKPVASAFAPPASRVPSIMRTKSRVPLLFISALLCLLVLGGIIAWLTVFQPFSVPQVTQPQQSFQSTGLGVSLSYPTGWTVQIDQKNATAQFSDSSHTAQFSIVVVAANGEDIGQYLLHQATQLGITGAKPGTPLTFAKVSWQQVQGTVQQNGANYAETLLATTHGDRLYSIIQQAPQATYADEEQVIFSAMRSSFQFLS